MPAGGRGGVACRHRQSQRGFAMLLVVLMAAVIAISLYMEVPRVAFESQRQKEQLLIDRGEQYKRAIKVFFNTNKRWPAKLEDLENFNGRRFLRKRYIDPMTGKDEWRPIHVTNGILTDSKVTKPPGAADQKDNLAGQYISETPGIGQTGTAATTGVAAVANRRRASDGLAPGIPNAPGAANAQGAAGETGEMTPGQQSQPGQQQAVPGQIVPGVPYPQGVAPPGTSPQPGLPGVQYPQGVTPAGTPSQPGIPGVPYPQGAVPGTAPGGQPGVPGQTVPGQIAPGVPYPTQVRLPGNVPGAQGAPGAQPAQGGGYISAGAYIGSQPSTPQQYPGQPVNPQNGGFPPTAYGTNPQLRPASPGAAGAPGTNVGAQSDAARAMLQQALFGPRPGGPPGTVAQGQVMGSGIAGFASTADEEGIKVYNDRTNYGEWEFVFDPQKDNRQPFNPVSGGAGTPAAQLGTQPGTPANQLGTPAGQMPGAQPVQQPTQPFGLPGGTGATPIRR